MEMIQGIQDKKENDIYVICNICGIDDSFDKFKFTYLYTIDCW